MSCSQELSSRLGRIACVALACASVACMTDREATSLPDIVIVLADDLGWKDVGFHGAGFPTPNIDRIAAEGVELTRFYAAPVCSPTRVALLTGRYPIRYGLQRVTIKPWTDLGVPPEEETLPEALGRAGYQRRGVFGKWHLGDSVRFHPLEQGFTEFVGHYGGSIDYFEHTRLGVLDWHHDFALSREEGYSTELIGRHAVRFIRESPADQPLFLYVPFNAIHSPNHATTAYLEANAGIDPENRRVKAAMTASMDDQIGAILDALEARGTLDDTLLLFFSDNGGVPPAGSSNEPLRGRKHTVYEGGIRVVAAARWPSGGIQGGRKVDTPVSVLDIFPTLMGIAGVEARHDERLDGEDVIKALRGDTSGRDDFEFHSYFNGQTIPGNGTAPDAERRERNAVVTSDWKLIREGPNLDRAENPRAHAKLELYRISVDPFEASDVSASHPDILAELLERAVRFRQLKPKDAMAMPLSAPEGWQAPPDWSMQK